VTGLSDKDVMNRRAREGVQPSLDLRHICERRNAGRPAAAALVVDRRFLAFQDSPAYERDVLPRSSAEIDCIVLFQFAVPVELIGCNRG
jgi:hypothetical protein